MKYSFYTKKLAGVIMLGILLGDCSIAQPVTTLPFTDTQQATSQVAIDPNLPDKQAVISTLISESAGQYSQIYASIKKYPLLMSWGISALNEALSSQIDQNTNLTSLQLKKLYKDLLTTAYYNNNRELVLFTDSLKGRMLSYNKQLDAAINILAKDKAAKLGNGSFSESGYYQVLRERLVNFFNNDNAIVPLEQRMLETNSCNGDCVNHPLFPTVKSILEQPFTSSETSIINNVILKDNQSIVNEINNEKQEFLSNHSQYSIVKNNPKVEEEAYHDLRVEVSMLDPQSIDRLAQIRYRVDGKVTTPKIVKKAILDAYKEDCDQLRSLVTENINLILPKQTYPLLSSDFRNELSNYYNREFTHAFPTSDLWDNPANVTIFNSKIIKNIREAYNQQHINNLLAAADEIVHTNPYNSTWIGFKDSEKELEKQLVQYTALSLNNIILNESRKLSEPLQLTQEAPELEKTDPAQEAIYNNAHIKEIGDQAHPLLIASIEKEQIDLFSSSGYVLAAKKYHLSEHIFKLHKKIKTMEAVISTGVAIVPLAVGVFTPAVSGFFGDKIVKAAGDEYRIAIYKALEAETLQYFTKDNLTSLLQKQAAQVQKLVRADQFKENKPVSLPSISILPGEIAAN